MLDYAGNKKDPIPAAMKTAKNKQTAKILLTALAVVVGVLNIFPFIFMLSSSFKPLPKIFEFPFNPVPQPFIFDNYIRIFDPQYFFLQWYKNTVIMVVLSLMFKVAVVSITAYAFARLRFRGRDKLFILFLAGLMMPGDVTLVQRYIIYKTIHITDSMWALILPAAFDVYFVFLLRQFFLTIPFELTEAALIDGYSHFKIFYKIILPLAKPAIVTMVIFSFVWAWNDYVNPLIFISDLKRQMLTAGIATFQNLHFTEYGLQMAGSSLALIPVIVLFLFTQKFFVSGLIAGSVKG